MSARQIQVPFADRSPCFRCWTPALGRVYTQTLAFDCETTALDERRPWITPAYVLGAAFDGKVGCFVERRFIAEFYRLHSDVAWVFHNAPFDLAVLANVVPHVDVYEAVDANRVWDTQLLQRLHLLATEGHVGEGRTSLSQCVAEHLGSSLSKADLDETGQQIRTSFDQFLNRPFAEIPREYLEYLARDAIATGLVYRQLRKRLAATLDQADAAFGYVSPQWLQECRRRFGPATHHIQLRAAIVLPKITANGLSIDSQRSQQLQKSQSAKLAELRERLRREGYQPGQSGCQKALQEILRRIAARHPDLSLERTPTSGDISTTEEALAAVVDREPFVRDFLEFKATEKLLGTFVEKLATGIVRPQYNVLVKTGRTSSYGELNAQNLPRDDAVRMCFLPPPGHTFIDADYVAIEMATLAQAVQSQFGVRSQLAAIINAGQDPHSLVASRVTGKPVNQVSREERQSAKAINFGKPGGMGDATLQKYAEASYGVKLTPREVADLSQAWFALFPEMERFLHEEDTRGRRIAEFFGLTPAAHADHTDSRKFLRYSDPPGAEHEPRDFLGFMLLKALSEPQPRTRRGELYDDASLDFFWTAVQRREAAFPPKLQRSIRNRQPSVRLKQAALALTDRRGVFTLTGRLRANAGFCARHNTIFQGLAADGAKLALWNLWRAGYAIHSFVHDQVLVAVPHNSRLALHVAVVRRLMIDGMREVLPDVSARVDAVVTEHWAKAAATVRDRNGRLRPWRATG